MRTEKEMFDLILGFAKKDNRVRGVVMNGSRANPAAKRDAFQDYDIVYLVNDFESFVSDHSWTCIFGEKLVYQLPDDTLLYPGEAREGHFGYLMQFADGNRIDLSLAKKELFHGYCFDDRLSVILLDKDGFLPKLAPPNESSHYIKKPTSTMFEACRCEFWWVSPYAAKGLWRGQLLFAQKHMEWCIRKELERMLGWLAGVQNGFEVSAGKCGDNLKNLLPQEYWSKYLLTYAPCDEQQLWCALFEAVSLFTQASQIVAKSLGFAYNNNWDTDVPKFLRYVKDLPRGAETMDFNLKG